MPGADFSELSFASPRCAVYVRKNFGTTLMCRRANRRVAGIARADMRGEDMPEENPSGALSRRLEPLCPRHDHVMAYDGTGIRWREGRDRHSRLQTVSSYHCGYFGCSEFP